MTKLDYELLLWPSCRHPDPVFTDPDPQKTILGRTGKEGLHFVILILPLFSCCPGFVHLWVCCWFLVGPNIVQYKFFYGEFRHFFLLTVQFIFIRFWSKRGEFAFPNLALSCFIQQMSTVSGWTCLKPTDGIIKHTVYLLPRPYTKLCCKK